jgi:hypothetical protein
MFNGNEEDDDDLPETQLPPEMILQFFIEQLRPWVDNYNDLPEDIRLALNSFIQGLNQDNIVAVLNEFILTWENNDYIRANNILPQIQIFLDHAHVGQYANINAQPTYDSALEGRQLSQYSIDGWEASQHADQEGYDSDPDNLSALRFMVSPPTTLAAQPASLPYYQYFAQPAIPAQQYRHPSYDVSQNSQDSQASGAVLPFQGDSFQAHQPSPDYYLTPPSQDPSQSSDTGTYTGRYQPPSTRNNGDTQQYHFAGYELDTPLEEIFTRDLFSKKDYPVIIGLDDFNFDYVSIMAKLTIITI